MIYKQNKYFIKKINKLEKTSLDGNNISILWSNSSKNIQNNSLTDDSMYKVSHLNHTINPFEKKHPDREDGHSLNKFNKYNYKKNLLNYKISNLITELIRFKFWKLNQQQKLKPIKNKGENLNYFQKSEKSINNLKINLLHKNISLISVKNKVPININTYNANLSKRNLFIFNY